MSVIEDRRLADAASESSSLGSNSSPNSENQPPPLALEALLIAVWALALNLIGNGAIPLWDRDEPRYARCVIEMMESGDYLHPTFNAEPRYHKPVLIYWLMVAGTAIGGANPFGARLVSSVAGMGTCLLVWWLGRRMMGRGAGFWSAIVLATAPFMIAESKMATTDATLTFFLVVCWFCLWELQNRDSWLLAGLFWIAFALAILTKGPVAPVFLIAFGALGWWWGGLLDCWKRLRWLWGVPLCILIAAPWFILITLHSRGEFYNVAVGYHVIRRATEGIEEHGGFPGYYVLLTLFLFFPWSILIGPALRSAWLSDAWTSKFVMDPETRRERIWGWMQGWLRPRSMPPQTAFVLAWIFGPLLVVEIMRTKLIHYYLPAVPAWGLLTGGFLAVLIEERAALADWVWGRYSLRSLLSFGIALGAGAIGSAFLLPRSLMAYAIAAGALIILGSCGGWLAFRSSRPKAAALTLALVWSLTMIALTGGFLPAAAPHLISHRVGQRLAQLREIHKAQPLMASFHPPGVVYAHGRPIPELDKRDEIAKYIRDHGPVLIALVPEEAQRLKNDKILQVEPIEPIEGFDIVKGKRMKLEFTILSLKPQPDPNS